MTKLQTTVVSALYLIFCVGPGTCSESAPIWSIQLHDAYINKNNAGMAEMNRSSGISRWDDAHVLIYYLTEQKRLAVRSSVESMAGGWSFSVQIVRTENGRVERSTTIPAWSSESELAVVAGGIVESDPGRLSFYSRSLKRLDRTFTYTPIEHLPRELSGMHGLGSSGRLYATEDQNRFVLVDRATQQSHLYAFDGATFQAIRDWIIPDLDWNSVSIRNSGVLFTRYSSRTEVDGIGFDGAPLIVQNPFGLRDPQICSFQISSNPETTLYVCGAVTILSPEDREVVYQPGKKEVVGLPFVASSDGRTVAVFDYSYKGGGVLDTTEQINKEKFLIIDIRAGRKICDLPIVPIAKSQLKMHFAGSSTLIVVNDAIVSAYRGLCATK